MSLVSRFSLLYSLLVQILPRLSNKYYITLWQLRSTDMHQEVEAGTKKLYSIFVYIYQHKRIILVNGTNFARNQIY